MEKRSKKFVYFLSFVMMFLIGIGLLLDVIFGTKLGAFGQIAKKIIVALSFFVVCINAFFFVRTKRSNVYLFLFVIFILLILICLIVPFVI
ncbi:MAG: hypothetical protein ACI4TI_00450 [Christensenellales bacterium]